MLPRNIGIIFSIIALSSAVLAGDTIRLKNETLHLNAKNYETYFKSQVGKSGKIADRFTPSLGNVYYIVQFDGAVKPEWTNSLAQSGVEIGSYLPDDAFIARIESAESWKAINESQHVNAVVSYEPKFRKSANLPVASIFNQDQSQRLIVKLALPTEFDNFLKTASDRGIQVVPQRLTEKILIIETRIGNIEKLSEIEGVEWVESYSGIQTYAFDAAPAATPAPAEFCTPEGNVAGKYDDLNGYETGTKLMGFDAAYARGFHGEGEIVGIADTGLDRGSTTDILSDFNGHVSKGYAMGMFSKGWFDPQGHGTHTSGSIVSSGLQSGGVLHGGAYGSSLIMESLSSPMFPDGLDLNPDFDELFGKIRNSDGAHVHSDSWGSANEGVYDSISAMVDEISWKYPDMLLIFAAGNSGQDMLGPNGSQGGDGHIDEGSVSSPATAKDCLTVGASKNLMLKGGRQGKMISLRDGTKKWGVEPIASSQLSENDKGMAAFSSIGPTNDGRIKPDVVAPGTNIISARSQYSGASVLWCAYNQVYSYAGGTSMATPLTAAAAAVTRQSLVKLGFANPSAALLKAVLMHTATDLFPGQFGTGAGQEFKTPRPNVNEGAGRVNVDVATNLSKSSLLDDEKGLTTGQTNKIQIKASKGQHVQATLVYTDAPAAASAAVALVNNLGLAVNQLNSKGRASKTYYPNHGNGPDNVNNAKMVSFNAPADGVYEVSINGQNVPKGRDGTAAQPYALVYTVTNE